MVNLPVPQCCKTQKKGNKIKGRLLSAPMEDHKLTGRAIWNTEKKIEMCNLGTHSHGTQIICCGAQNFRSMYINYCQTLEISLQQVLC